jgi:hypothetical protein
MSSAEASHAEAVDKVTLTANARSGPGIPEAGAARAKGREMTPSTRLS